jgi:hypothetical protein
MDHDHRATKRQARPDRSGLAAEWRVDAAPGFIAAAILSVPPPLSISGCVSADKGRLG